MVLLPTLTGNVTLTYPTPVGSVGKTIKVVQTGTPGGFTVTHSPAVGVLSLTDSGNELTVANGALTVEAIDATNIRQVSNAVASATTTLLTYGRVRAVANLVSKSFGATGVGTAVDFTGTVYSSGVTFSGTNGITPSVTGRYRASYYLNVGSDETANNATIHVVQGGVSLGSVYINQHNSAGSVNQSAGFIDVTVAAGTPVFLHYQPDISEGVAFDQGSYFQLDQLPTAIAPVIDTIAEYGENNAIVGQTVATGAAYIDVTGSAFTLPSAGVWEVEYVIQGKGNANGAETQVIVTTSAGVDVGNSQSMYSAPGLANVQMTLTQKVRITTTEATAYKLQIRTTGAGFTTQNSTSASGVLGGVSKVTWLKIAGQLPSTGATVDYINVNRTSAQAVANNSPILFNETISGNIPYNSTTGRFTLSAGKTYKLEGNIAIVESASIVTTKWYNVTNSSNISPGAYNGAGNYAGVVGSNQSTAIFTPTVTTEVELRNISGTTKTIGGTSVATNDGSSSATIVQIGSTNNIGGSTSVNDQSSSGYFDVGNMRLQWGTHADGNLDISTVTLPAAFANTTYVVTCTNAQEAAFSLGIGTRTTTTFNIDRSSTATTAQTWGWFAIGQKP